jgi:hypothetical protein
VHCQELVRTLNVTVAGSPSSETLRQIERVIAADLRPVRPLAANRHFLAGFAGVFVLVVAVAVYRLGAYALAVMSPLQAGVILCSLAASAALLADSLVHQMVPGSRYRIPPKLLPVLVIISLAIVTAVLFQFQPEREFWANGWWCLRVGSSIALIASVPFWLLLRRGAILSPRLTGAAAGMLAGLVGTGALQIHCPNLGGWHILFSHLGAPVLGSVAGLLLGFAVEIAGRHPIALPRKTIVQRP